MEYAPLIKLMKTRRSIRKFLPDPVPREDIEKLLDAAASAPSGGNKQNWFFIIAESEPVKARMLEAITGKIKEFSDKIDSARAKNEFISYTKFYTFFIEAPVVIAVIKKPYDSLASRIMDRYGLAKARQSSADIQGPSAAVQNLLLAAHSLGYGACWMTGPMIAKDELEGILGVDKEDDLIALIPVGKPSMFPKATDRKPAGEICRYL